MPTKSSPILAGATSGLARGIASFINGRHFEQQGAAEEQARLSSLAAAMGKIDLQRAQQREAEAKAAGMERSNELQTPGAIRSRAMLSAGAPLDAAGDVDQYLNSGRIDKYQLGAGQAGPVLPTPTWAKPEGLSRISQAMAADQAVIGAAAKSQEDYFKGQNQQFESALARALVDGTAPKSAFSPGMAILKASPIYKIPEGYQGDQYTGAIDVQAPVNAARQGYVAAQTGAQKANAVQSYATAGASAASADQHRAQTRKTLAELNLMDGMPGAQANRQQAAVALGIPLADIDPYASMTPKTADQARKVAAANMDRMFAERGTQIDGEMAMARDAQRFMELNKGNSTGGINAVSGVGAVRGAFDGDFSEMRAIANRLVPKMREPGSGATSDFDARLFASATIGTDKPASTNRAIADAMIARAQLSADKLDFDRAYADLNGHLRGADRAWKQYVDANPIFDPRAQEQGRLALNPGRVSYQDYYRGRMGGGAPGAQQPAAGAPPQAGGRPPLDSFRR
ncbi:MAG: hypothetical protein KBC73_13155 [Burkholderiaceae bacterium]|nr:hypothetical protein [Burkholderiaceae bacterium]